MTRHLEESWRGHAGRQALEAMRRYISESLDGLTPMPVAGRRAGCVVGSGRRPARGRRRRRSRRDLTEVRVRYSEPAVAAGNAVDEIPAPPALPGASVPALPALPVLSPAATVPASYGAPIPNPGHEAMLPIDIVTALGRNGFDDHGGIVPTQTAGSPPPPSAFVGAMRNAESPLPAATPERGDPAHYNAADGATCRTCSNRGKPATAWRSAVPAAGGRGVCRVALTATTVAPPPHARLSDHRRQRQRVPSDPLPRWRHR